MRQLSLSRAARPAPCARFALHAIAASLAAAFGTCAIPAWAQLPTGAQVVNGNAGINTNGSQMTITNSPNAVLNWQSFSIGAQNTVHFAQADAASKVLNRVVGNDPSQILGALTSNGSVWLINPNGVLFGQGARIDVGGLVASTMALSNADFLAGRARFDGAGGLIREVRNEGAITTTFGGRVWLVGRPVSNAGTITTPGGSVVMASGDSVEIVDSGLPNITVQVNATSHTNTNTGTIQAVDGRIDLLGGIVNQNGIVRANSLDALGKVNIVGTGDVTLGATSQTRAESPDDTRPGGTLSITSETGELRVAGLVSASGSAGGAIALAGDAVNVAQGAKVWSNGDTGKAGDVTVTGRVVDVAGEVFADGAIGAILKVEATEDLSVTGSLSSYRGDAQGGEVSLKGRNVSVAGKLWLGGETGGNLNVSASDGLSVSGSAISYGDDGNVSLQASQVSISGEASVAGFNRGTVNVLASEGLAVSGTVSARDIAPGQDNQGVGGAVILKGSQVAVSGTVSANGNSAGTVNVEASEGLAVTGNVSASARENLSGTAGNGGDVTLKGRDVSVTGSVWSEGAAGGQLLVQANEGLAASGSIWSEGRARAGGDVTLQGREVAVDGAVWSEGRTGGKLLVAADNRASVSGSVWSEGTTGAGGDVAVEGREVAIGGSVWTDGASGGSMDVRASERVSVAGSVWSNGGASGTGGNVTIKGSEVSIEADGAAWSVGGSAGKVEVQASGGELSVAGMLASNGSTNGGTIALAGNGIHIGQAALLDTAGTNGGNISIDAKNGTLDILGTLTNAGNPVGTGNSTADMSLKGASILIGSGAELHSSGNHGGTLTLDATDGTIAVRGSVSAVDRTANDNARLSFKGRNVLLLEGSDISTNRWSTLSGYHVAPNAFPQAEEVVLRGGTLNTGRGPLLVTASTVEIDGAQLTSDEGTIDIFGSRVNLNGARISSGANGDALNFETETFANAGSQLSTPAGRWLVYLRAGASFDANAFADLDYRFVQVNAGSNGNWATPVLSGVGQHGILMSDPLDPKLKLVVRQYDGTPYATFTDIISHNAPAGFDVRRTGSWTTGQGNFLDKHVGYDKSITYQGDAPLFKVQTTKGIEVYGARPYYVGDITARELSVGGLVAADKVYDASRNASVSGLLLNSIEGDDVRLTELHGLFDTKDVGQDKQVSVTVGTLAGDDARNYVFRPPSNLSTTADITPRPVTADGLVAADKVYDGTRNAEISGRLSGVLPGDDFRAGQLNGQFDTKNVGNNKTVTITASGAAGRDAANYVLEGPLTTTASITPREAQIGLTGQVRKVYDGNTVATLAPGQFVLSGILASDAVVIDGPVQGRYDNANAGQNKTVTVTGPFVISGADAINYTYGGVVLDGGAHTVSTTVSGAIGEITRRTLALTGVTAANKVYDARNSATILGGSLGNVVADDDVRIGDLTGTFEDKHAGTGKLVTVSIGGLSGTAAGNYELPAGTATTRADITPRPISVQGLSASDKVYDGRDTASISGTPSGALPGDQLQIGSLEGRFSDKNVGTNKAVIVTGGALSGADAGNYRLDGLGNTTASITPRAAQIGITGQVQKEYDGTQAATLGAGQYALSGILDADAVTVAGPTAGRYDSADAGQGKTVTVSGPFVISGADAINYSFGGVTLGGTGANTITTTATGIGAIMRRMLSLSSLVAANKVYDGTVTADVDARLGNVVGDDEVTLGALSGAFESRHAGTGKRVNVSTGALSGADAANYMLPGTAFSTTADITPLTLSAAGIRASDKVYDGSTSASLTGAPTGVLAGDQVTIGTLTGQFDNKNVGTGKTVAISGGALSGADAGNYRLDGRLATTASITPRPVTLALTGQAAKEYDATSSAVLGANQYTMANLVAGDDIGVRGPTQGSYDTPNVGQQKAVSVSGPFDFSGVDAANYSLNGVRLGSGVNASVTANIGRITPAVLTYQANPAVVESTLPFGTLNGTVTGFRGGDTLASATTGQLAWQAGTANGAAPGSYPILGAGLAAANYEFVQAPGNATALVVRPGETIRSVTSSATNAVSAALAASSPVPNLPPASSPVADSTSPGAAKAFSPVRIGSMSQEELAQMLAQRRNFKQNLFSAAIYKLEMDPSLADLQPCTTVMEASSGACRISAAQLELLHAARPQAHVQEQTMGRAAAKTSNLPRIERKIAVLFGVNEYSDKAIPRLENAITDVDAISKLFAEKLGYEVRVLHNPGKAEMIRALNALATEVGSADSVVVYYAGHGYSLEKNGAGYWLPSDASASDPRQWISNSDVAKILSGIRSRQMALISDSCYSGAFAREGMANVGRNVNADDVLSKRSVVVLSSGGDEPVPDEGRGNHSIFAWNLMQVVGSVANWKPGSTVFEGVQEAVRKEFPQTPQYGALTAAGHQAGGDYLFEFRSR